MREIHPWREWRHGGRHATWALPLAKQRQKAKASAPRHEDTKKNLHKKLLSPYVLFFVDFVVYRSFCRAKA